MPAEIDADRMSLEGGGLEAADDAAQRHRVAISDEPQPGNADENGRDNSCSRAWPDPAGSDSDDLERLLR